MAGADGSGDTTGGFTEAVEGDICSFMLSHTASTAIGTVQIVTWSTDLPNLGEAHIDFGLSGAELGMTAPVDLAEPNYRTLLLGMKGGREYSFRIVASSEAGTCTSPEISFTTGPLPKWAPAITKGGSGTGASKGFIITTPGLRFLSVDPDGEWPSAYIFDADGDVVWWTTNEAKTTTSARMSWDGKTMLSVNAYAGPVHSVSMDGLVTREITELDGANHDLAVLPDGGIATMIAGATQSFAEMTADGSVVEIVPDLETLFQEGAPHPNAVHYYPEDDSFTLSDLFTSTIVKFTRTGELVWRLGKDAPLGDAFALVGFEHWNANHGHHLTADGHILIFDNYFPNEEPGDTSIPDRSGVLELLLDEETWTATKLWEHTDGPLLGATR